MDFGRDLPLLLVLAGLIGSAVVLGASEAAILRVFRVRVEVEAQDGDRAARRLLRVLDDLARVMNTVLLVVLLVQIGAAAVTSVLAERNFGNVGVTIASVILTLVLFVYAEAIPKTYAVRYPLGVAKAAAPLLLLLAFLLRPIVSVLVKFADLQAPGPGIAGPVGVSEEELLRLASEAVAAGRLEASDLELIDRALDLDDRPLGSILTPRPDIVAVRTGTSVAQALRVAVRAGHRRIPVYQSGLDDIAGMVTLRGLAAAISAEETPTLADLQRDVLYVPEHKTALELLRQMQHTGVHLAVAIDEYGGTAGIVTIEDVVEALVGPVTDEGEETIDPFRQIAPGHWRVDGSLEVSELERDLGIELPEGDWFTVAGLIAGITGRIPEVGDSVDVANFRFEVAAASKTRVTEIDVTRHAHKHRHRHDEDTQLT